jgi:hypothetical protein
MEEPRRPRISGKDQGRARKEPGKSQVWNQELWEKQRESQRRDREEPKPEEN